MGSFPNERLNLGIRDGGPLSSPQDETNHNHPAQRTHGVHAKHVGVCGDDTSGAVEGAVVVAAATGAHMGLHTMVSRGSEERGGSETCRPVFIDCFSEEANKAPVKWTCRSRNEFGTDHGESTLTLVAMDTAPDDPLCAGFEDEDSFDSSVKAVGGRLPVERSDRAVTESTMMIDQPMNSHRLAFHPLSDQDPIESRRCN